MGGSRRERAGADHDGSRARADGRVDEFSDFDLEIIADQPELLAGDDAWFRCFGRVWVHLPTTIRARHETRLVFYEGGMKVDLSLCGRERVRAMVEAKTLDGLYERGYRVLLDKGTSYTVLHAGGDTIVDMGNGDQVVLVGVNVTAPEATWLFFF